MSSNDRKVKFRTNGPGVYRDDKGNALYATVLQHAEGAQTATVLLSDWREESCTQQNVPVEQLASVSHRLVEELAHNAFKGSILTRAIKITLDRYTSFMSHHARLDALTSDILDIDEEPFTRQEDVCRELYNGAEALMGMVQCAGHVLKHEELRKSEHGKKMARQLVDSANEFSEAVRDTFASMLVDE